MTVLIEKSLTLYGLWLCPQWLGADEQEEEADPVQVLEDPQYQDLRAEASTHYRLRHECFQKAQEAHRRGLKAVACFYSQQVSLTANVIRTILGSENTDFHFPSNPMCNIRGMQPCVNRVCLED